MAAPKTAITPAADEKAAVADLEKLGFTLLKEAQGRNTRLILSRSKSKRIVIVVPTNSGDIAGRDR